MNHGQQTIEKTAKTICFLGLPLHCVSYEDMFRMFDGWINGQNNRGHSVALINVNCCVSGLLNPNRGVCTNKQICLASIACLFYTSLDYQGTNPAIDFMLPI